MTGKMEGPPEGGDRPGEAQGPKRPYATLDLKATELKDENPAGEEVSAASADPDATGGEEPGVAEPPEADRPSAIPGFLKGGAGVTSFLTHLAAGLVGGFLALLGADTMGSRLAPQLGLPSATQATNERTAQLDKRLAALEQRVGQETAQAKAAGSQSQARVEELARKVTALGEQQTRLEGTTRSLAEKAGQSADEERLAKLEQRLATLAAAAGDPQKSGIPQLAVITGKLADLETSVANQLAALRKGVTSEIDTRLSQASEASEAAKSGTQRMDRDVATLKADSARLNQRVEALKADDDRLGETLRALKEEAAAFRNDIEARLKTHARTADVTSAVQPVAGKVATLEQELQTVVRNEEGRRADAQRIVLALELANLKRTIDRGQRFATELAELKKTAGGRIDLGALDRYKEDGVPTLADLQRDFRPVITATLDAESEPVDGSVFDRLIAGARSVVRVRKISHAADDASAEAVIGRMEAALKEGRLGEVLEEGRKLPPKVSGPAQDWLAAVEARYAVDRAIAGIEVQLKASLGGTPPPADKAVK